MRAGLAEPSESCVSAGHPILTTRGYGWKEATPRATESTQLASLDETPTHTRGKCTPETGIRTQEEWQNWEDEERRVCDRGQAQRSVRPGSYTDGQTDRTDAQKAGLRATHGTYTTRAHGQEAEGKT